MKIFIWTILGPVHEKEIKTTPIYALLLYYWQNEQPTWSVGVYSAELTGSILSRKLNKKKTQREKRKKKWPSKFEWRGTDKEWVTVSDESQTLRRLQQICMLHIHKEWPLNCLAVCASPVAMAVSAIFRPSGPVVLPRWGKLHWWRRDTRMQLPQGKCYFSRIPNAGCHSGALTHTHTHKLAYIRTHIVGYYTLKHTIQTSLFHIHSPPQHTTLSHFLSLSDTQTHTHTP